jgi:hypothetical protein
METPGNQPSGGKHVFGCGGSRRGGTGTPQPPPAIGDGAHLVSAGNTDLGMLTIAWNGVFSVASVG